MKIKKWIVCILALCIAIALLPLNVSAASVIASGSYGGPTTYWKLTSDGTLTVTGQSHMQGLNAYEYPWAEYADKIKKVVVESGITAVSYEAFAELPELTTVYMADTVSKINQSAFARCEKLTEVKFPSRLVEIGAGAFLFCHSLTRAQLPDYLVTIGDRAFAGCEKLSEVKLGSGSRLETIGEFAFNGTAITSFIMPGNLKSIGKSAFAACPYLKTLTLKEGLEYIGFDAFVDCPELTGALYLPASLTWVEYTAFQGDHKWTSIEINTSVTLSDFANNPMLKSVVIGGKCRMMPSFAACTGLEKVTIQAPITEVNGTFAGCTSLKEIVLPNTVKMIGFDSFRNTGLKRIVIPDSVTEIGMRAFADCTELEYVKIGKSMKELSNGVFENCTALEEVDLGNVTYIGWGVFENCTSLEMIEIPGTVKTLETSAFGNCVGLAAVTFLGDAPAFAAESSVFFNVGATVYYPAGNPTWTEDVRKDYGGKLTWVAYESPVVRLAGANRWDTALKTADEMKLNLGVEKFDAVIIASGNDFADALAGSYLSTVKNAPILLAWGKGGQYQSLDVTNIRYITENLAPGGTVYILGGTNAVPRLYDSALGSYHIRRLGGANRFETNLLILAEAGVKEGDEILVCTSTNFADSLSASATGKPILLVFNESGKLYGKQPEFLAGLTNCAFTVIGGENAVGTGLADAISAYGPVNRLAGANRFETSVMVAKKYFENPECAVLAYAWNYPDGLCGGALAYTVNAPLILTMTGYEQAAAEYAQAQSIGKALVLGGKALIADESVRDIVIMDEWLPIAVK